MYKPIPYPRHVKDSEGRTVTVRDAEHETSVTGVLMNEDGTVADFESEDPRPPTLEEVIARGYAPEVAEKIVDEEQHKFKAGYPPYGTNQPPAPPAPDSGDGVPLSEVGQTEPATETEFGLFGDKQAPE